MAEESGDEHEEQADDYAGREREVEGKVLALDQDVARQASDVRDTRKDLEGDAQ